MWDFCEENGWSYCQWSEEDRNIRKGLRGETGAFTLLRSEGVREWTEVRGEMLMGNPTGGRRVGYCEKVAKLK